MVSKPQTFSGHFVTKSGQALSFNLYSFENAKSKETADNIMDNMRGRHLVPLQRLFAGAGLKLHGFKFFSPEYYNFQGDSVDLVVSIQSKEKLLSFIRKNESAIQRMLSANKSYDGYRALTAADVDEVIRKVKENSDVDVMVVTFILRSYPLDEYNDFYDLLVEEEEGV